MDERKKNAILKLSQINDCCFRPRGFQAATLSLTRTWTKGVCVTTPACVSAVTQCPVGGSTPETLSQLPRDRSATATRAVYCQCGREKVRTFAHSPTHPFTHSSRNSPDFTRSLFFSPSSPHRADPPLHHRAPAGQTCAALHQPSERRLQDLHQVLLPTLFLLCVLFRLSFCNRSSSALVSAPVSSS